MIEDISEVRRAIGSLMSHGALTTKLDAPHGHQRMGAEIYKVAMEALDRLEEVANMLGEFEKRWREPDLGPPTKVREHQSNEDLFEIAIRMADANRK